MRRSVPWLLAPASFAGLLALPVHAAVQLDAQTRTVEYASVGVHQEAACTLPQYCDIISETETRDDDADAAVDFSPFSVVLTSPVFPSATVSQTSTLGAWQLQAGASHGAVGTASLTSGSEPWLFIADFSTHGTRSFFRTDFTVDEPTGYALVGEVAAGGAGSVGEVSVSVELRRSTGALLHRIALEDDEGCYFGACLDLGPLSLDETGTLAPGSYVLEAELVGETGVIISVSTGTAAANAHTGHFDVDLRLGPQVPAPPWFAPVLAAGLAALARSRLAGRTG